MAQLKELVNHELEARLKWVVSRISREGEGEGEGETAGLGTEGTTDSPSRSDAVRYGIFILSGLIAQIIAAQPKKVPKKDDEEDYEGHDFEGFEEDEDAGAESAVAEVLCSVGATLQSSETLDVIVGAYCQARCARERRVCFKRERLERIGGILLAWTPFCRSFSFPKIGICLVSCVKGSMAVQ